MVEGKKYAINELVMDNGKKVKVWRTDICGKCEKKIAGANRSILEYSLRVLGTE